MSDQDAGLEAFLQLVEPNLPLPHIMVEPCFLNIQLGQGVIQEVPLRIKNLRRGHLFGTVELVQALKGLTLSQNKFDSNWHGNQEANLILRIDSSELTAGQIFRASIRIDSNAEDSVVNIPLTLKVRVNPQVILEQSVKLCLIAFVVYFLYLMLQSLFINNNLVFSEIMGFIFEAVLFYSLYNFLLILIIGSKQKALFWLISIPYFALTGLVIIFSVSEALLIFLPAVVSILIIKLLSNLSLLHTITISYLVIISVYLMVTIFYINWDVVNGM